MSKKKNSFLPSVIVLIVLAVVAIFVISKEKQNIRTHKEFLLDIEAEQISKITLDNSRAHIVLEKQDDTWQITEPENYLASQEEMDRMLNQLAEISVLSTTSSNPENAPKYGIDSTSIVVEIAETNNQTHTFLIGRTDPSGGTFVKLKNQPETYLVSGYLRYQFNRSVNNFRDKYIFNNDMAEINNVWVQGENQWQANKNEQGQWLTDGSFQPADSLAFSNFFNQLPQLQTIDFADSTAAAELQNQKPMLEIGLKNGEALISTLQLWPHAQTARLYARNSQQPYTFIINKRFFEKVLQYPPQF